MEYENRQCVECSIIFKPIAHNGIYCSADCRKVATNKKVLQKYYDNKARRSGEVSKKCKYRGCKTILSRYNKEDICEAHKIERFIKRLKKWGWDEEMLRREME